MKVRGITLYLHGANDSVLEFLRVEPAPDKQKATNTLVIWDKDDDIPLKAYPGSISSRASGVIEDTDVFMVDGIVYVSLHPFELKGEPRPDHYMELRDEDGEMAMGEDCDYKDAEGEIYGEARRHYVRPLGIAGRYTIKDAKSYRALEDTAVPDFEVLRDKLTDTVLSLKRSAENGWQTGSGLAPAVFPILADALQDAGLDCDDVLNDLRAGGFTGAWVLPFIDDAQAHFALSAFLPTPEEMETKKAKKKAKA